MSKNLKPPAKWLGSAVGQWLVGKSLDMLLTSAGAALMSVLLFRFFYYLRNIPQDLVTDAVIFAGAMLLIFSGFLLSRRNKKGSDKESVQNRDEAYLQEKPNNRESIRLIEMRPRESACRRSTAGLARACAHALSRRIRHVIY